MDREMMLLQTRQDFVDMHKELWAGKRITLGRYEQMAADLQKMDGLNLEWLLEFSEKTEEIPFRKMWQDIAAYIADVHKKGQWRIHKERHIGWENGQLKIYDE